MGISNSILFKSCDILNAKFQYYCHNYRNVLTAIEGIAGQCDAGSTLALHSGYVTTVLLCFIQFKSLKNQELMNTYNSYDSQVPACL